MICKLFHERFRRVKLEEEDETIYEDETNPVSATPTVQIQRNPEPV